MRGVKECLRSQAWKTHASLSYVLLAGHVAAATRDAGKCSPAVCLGGKGNDLGETYNSLCHCGHVFVETA